MLKKLSLIFIMLLLSGVIVVSQIMVNQKPDTSKIPKDQWVAALVKPSVVRVVQGYSIRWVYEPPVDSDYEVDAIIYDYLDGIESITDYYTTGSGAIINSNGYIITNAHVVDILQTEDAQLMDQAIAMVADELSYVFQVDFETMYYYLRDTLFVDAFGKVLKVVLPSGEIVDGEVKSYGAPTGEGKDVSVIKIEKKNLPSIRLGDSDKLNLQDNITIFGYPGAADSSMFSDESSLVVSITNGKVSAVDKKSVEGAPILQVDAAATHGNSGGPITNDEGKVIGLLTFRSEQNPNEVQGFNFAVPVSTVKEFVDQAGAENGEASLDRLYREGLDLYWSGYYKQALDNFEAVKRIYPEHSDIDRFIKDSQEKLPESKTLWSEYKSTALIVDIVCGVFIFLFLIILIIDIAKGSKKQKVPQYSGIPVQNTMPGFMNNQVNNPVNNQVNNQTPWPPRNPPMNNYMPNNNQPNNSQPNTTPMNNGPVNTNPMVNMNIPINKQPPVENSREINKSIPVPNIPVEPQQKQQHLIVGKLYEVSGPHKNASIVLSNEPLVMGRDPRLCKIVFPSALLDIGRVHCQISFDPERQLFLLKDLSSSTGTFLSSGEKVNPGEEKLLKSGEGFYLCTKDISFEVWLE